VGLTPEEYRQLLRHAPKPRSKHGNIKTVTLAGESYDSKKEATYHQQLKMREHAGEVKDIRRQVPFELCTVSTDLGMRPSEPVHVHPVATYRADFVFLEYGVLVVADCKGQKRNSESFQTKKRWMKAQYNIEVREVR
jgi:hypothetical protein